MPTRVFITIAERSADLHAANLARALRSLEPDITIDALGGEALRAAGATVHHDTVSRAAMGLAAFKRYGEVKRLLAWTAEFYRTRRPDLHICCDSWTMNVHFARLARSFGVPVLYYIAPQVWASRERRTRELARVSDAVACILPFEEAFLRERGVNATYVGHPLFDEIATHLSTTRAASGPLSPAQGERARVRGTTGETPEDDRSSGAAPVVDKQESFASTTPRPPHPNPLPLPRGEGVGSSRASVIALPCGSRAGVARANFPRQLEAARRIRTEIPDATFRVPTTRATHSIVASMIADAPYVTAGLDAFDTLIPACDLAITVSGTATLHIAAHNVPMIVVYYANPILWQLVGRWLVRIRTYAMVNLLANEGRDEPAKHVVPEYIPWNGPVDAVANRAIDLLRNTEQLLQQREQIARVIATINRPGASTNTARLAMSLLKKR